MMTRTDTPATRAELDAHQTIELLVRGLLIDPRNQIISGQRIALNDYLAQLDALRAIAHAKESA